MPQVSFGSFSKRRNSTKRPTSLSDTRDVRLKETTSFDAPTFIIQGNDFNYNYAMWGSRYYFIVDIRSVYNNLTEIDCVLDPLATYKTEILASTQFVSYSSHNSSIWLPDTRIPILKSAQAQQSVSATGILSRIGCYILSAVGKDRCFTWMITAESDLGALLDSIQRWDDQDVNDIMDYLDFTSPESALEGVATVMARTSLMGNAYEAAPSCIRSCIWVPFDYALAPSLGTDTIWLGLYDTGVSAYKISGKPVRGTQTVNIPWTYSDWRRAVCEDVYLYLPLVGMVQLSGDSLTHVSSITIDWSVTYTDGCIAYEVKAGNEVIGSYGGQCSANYPLGIAQQASAGSIVQTAFQGAQRTVAAGMDTAIASASLNPVSAGLGVAAGAVNTAMTGIDALYQIGNQALTSNPSCVGGIGGGSGVGLDMNTICYTVSHPTIINPSDMKDTMGLPTMKPMQLSQLVGYCQCTNAHVEAPAMAQELNAIDTMLNSGFYIE